MDTTKLYFRYSPAYDRTLATTRGGSVSEREVAEGQEYTERIRAFWRPKNDQIFEYYRGLGLSLPSFWLAYPVHPAPGLIPFNDPLTLPMTDDLEAATATVIHELCHTFFAFAGNAARAEELWRPLQRILDREAPDVREHVLVNALAAGGYYEVFNEPTVERLIALEAKFPTLERSWKIIFEQIGHDLSLLRKPIQLIESFSANPGNRD